MSASSWQTPVISRYSKSCWAIARLSHAGGKKSNEFVPFNPSLWAFSEFLARATFPDTLENYSLSKEKALRQSPSSEGE